MKGKKQKSKLPEHVAFGVMLIDTIWVFVILIQSFFSSIFLPSVELIDQSRSMTSLLITYWESIHYPIPELLAPIMISDVKNDPGSPGGWVLIMYFGIGVIWLACAVWSVAKLLVWMVWGKSDEGRGD